MTVPRVSVVVPVYNGGGLIAGCMASLDAQTLAPEDYEVIVVDDGSRDRTREVAEAFAHSARAPMRVIAQPQKKGPAAARNAGIAAARASVIAFTDADCEADPDWLARGLAALDADLESTGVEGRTLPKGDPGTLTHQMRNETGGLWMTCNMLYRRSALDEVGGFDERFRLAFLEDSDVAFALLDRGARIVWDPDVVVRHLVLPIGRRKFGREARKRFYNPLLYKKHPEMYRRHLRGVVPGLPPLHLKYMGSVGAVCVFAAAGWWIPAAVAALPAGLFAKRVAHAYRAHDPLSMMQAAAHPFVQTYWVARGAAHFRSFSWDI
ncbi:MAG: glycosyltransferase [Actinomycetota bacterium]